MKSQIWLLDPRPNLPSIVKAVEKGFELSEASNTPVMLEVRIRACHVHGRFPAKDNVRPSFTLRDAMENPRRAGRPHRAAAGELPAREGEDREALARRGEVHRGQQAQRVLRRRSDRHRHRRCRAACTTPPCARSRSWASPTRSAHRACRSTCMNVTYPLIDREIDPLCARQARHPDRRGRPAGIHRAGDQHHPAPRRRADRASKARACCRWPANTPARSLRDGVNEVRAQLSRRTCWRSCRIPRRRTKERASRRPR